MSRRLTTVAVLVALTLAIAPVASGAPPNQFPAGAAGLGDPYFPGDGNGGYDVQHYDLKLRYDPAKDLLTGEATIRARATQNLSAFNLDFVGLKLRSVAVNGTAATTSRRGQELTVKPRTGLQDGATFTVVAKYDGVPTPLEEFGGASGFVHTDDGAIVVGQPHGASSWFPANDHPRDTASFAIAITVPAGVEALSNGILAGQSTSAGWTTWSWLAVEPMATYLAMMAIGQFDMSAYQAGGIKYWDAIASSLYDPIVPAQAPVDGSQLVYSQVGDSSWKRLTRTIAVPPGGAQLTFSVNRDTEEAWDFFFVEARTAGGNDWTTLPDTNGHTGQDVGACPYNYLDLHPFMERYVTPVLQAGDPSTPDDDWFTCDPVGTTGAWYGASGRSDGWETWNVDLPNAGSAVRQVEVSFSYASDWIIQGNGVAIDAVIVSTNDGSTSFEADGNPLDGWVAPLAGPTGSPTNPNTWTVAPSVPEIPGQAAGAQLSLDKQPQITAWQADMFGTYPFSASGGVVHAADLFFALENQTRSTYSRFFFGPEGGDDVVVHELAHQWFGDSLTLDSWQHIWLNEGFATYAEWLWSEREGHATAEQIFQDWASMPVEEDWFWALPIGDPGPESLFAFQVYVRGAMTMHALRKQVGDVKFFRILKAWATTKAGSHVTTRDFIDLAEGIHGKDLDPLFSAWLSSGKPPISTKPGRRPIHVKQLTPASRSLVQRLQDRPGQPFRESGVAVD